ncbi:hypothetical protein JD844_001042 [Phrynosoma platyrhinos]|uniref:Ig-like domain-containing protein n=1 Tax=Phrynosoma platyrhinos TaxID=52577 RepID=A0ABQ7T8Y7_PHRPL|nr:hypothetical protein JD844_001042 [Phrynosoma platyrhinos]
MQIPVGETEVAFSDVQLVSSGPGVVRPGETLSLVCKVTGFSISTSSSYAWHWIRQPLGKGLEWVAAINVNTGGKFYADSLKSRTIISSDTSKNEFSLQLNSPRSDDLGVYFCARESTVRQGNWGGVQKEEKPIFSRAPWKRSPRFRKGALYRNVFGCSSWPQERKRHALGKAGRVQEERRMGVRVQGGPEGKEEEGGKKEEEEEEEERKRRRK